MSVAATDVEIAEEDRLRANWYGLLGQLLGAAPEREIIARLAKLTGDDSDLGQTLGSLAAAARAATPEALRDEYFSLFVGVGRGELIPYGSYYLTGFLHEKPLARLRSDLSELGVERKPGVVETEDHIAALCDTMAGLITGRFGEPASLSVQRSFFRDHIGSWAPRFFEDLQAAKGAVFYMPVGAIGSLVMAIEAQAFEMAA